MPQINYNTNLGNYNPQIKGENIMIKTLNEINGNKLKITIEVTDDGEVYKNGKLVTPFVISHHLATSVAFVDGTRRNMYVHQLVMYAFTGKLSNKAEGTAIHHINSRKFDNRLVNLELTTTGNNVTKYVHNEAQNQSTTVYDEARITDGVVTLKHKGLLLADYAINIAGEVLKWDKSLNQWKIQNQYIGNNRYPSNVLVNVNGHGVSLSQLMAENFMILENRKFKVFQVDKGNGFENDFHIYNLRVACSGDSRKLA